MSPDMWEELSKLYKEGRIRAIGVSNFLQPHLEALADNSDIIPAVNQFEISPLNTQKGLIKYCQERGIAVEAMSTFSHYRSVEPRMEIIQNPLLEEISARHSKSVVQIVIYDGGAGPEGDLAFIIREQIESVVMMMLDDLHV